MSDSRYVEIARKAAEEFYYCRSRGVLDKGFLERLILRAIEEARAEGVDGIERLLALNEQIRAQRERAEAAEREVERLRQDWRDLAAYLGAKFDPDFMGMKTAVDNFGRDNRMMVEREVERLKTDLVKLTAEPHARELAGYRERKKEIEALRRERDEARAQATADRSIRAADDAAIRHLRAVLGGSWR